MRRSVAQRSPEALKIQLYTIDSTIKPLNHFNKGSHTTDKMPVIRHKSQKAETSDFRHKHRIIVE
jgi:hypothetical protein